MGGAFGSLGGDLSAISDNPAAASIFLFPEIGFNYEINTSQTNVNENNRNFSLKNSFSDLNQFGLVISLKNSEEGPFKRINFAFNINKEQEFQNNLNYLGSSSIGIDQFFLNNAQGLPLSDLELRSDETITDLYDFLGLNYGYGDQQAFLGYNAYIIDPVSSSQNNTSYVSAASYDKVNHDYYLDRFGDHKKYSFTISTQYKNSLYIGVNLNSHNVNYNETMDLYESNYSSNSSIEAIRFNNQLISQASGFSMQIGAIAKIKDKIRIGVSYDSPTYLNFTEESFQFLQTDHYENEVLVRDIIDPQVSNLSEYKITTPSKTSFSFGYLIGNKGIFSAQISTKNYGNIQFEGGQNLYFRMLNEELATTYKNASMLRLGGEYLIKKVSLRAGYYKENSSLKLGDNSHSGYTFGLGYDFGGRLLSIAFKSADINLNHSLANSGIPYNISADQRRNSIMASYNFKL